jgi:hypothetical protein
MMSSAARMSYAAALKKQNVEEGDKMEAALASLAVLRSNVTPKEVMGPTQVQRVYVAGFSRMPIRELKGHLYNLRVRMKKVFNLAFVSRDTLEFLLAADYVEAFQQKMSELSMRVLENYDPSKPQDVKATDDVRKAILKAFTTRVENHISSPAVSPVAQAFYQKWLKEVNPDRVDRLTGLREEEPNRVDRLVGLRGGHDGQEVFESREAFDKHWHQPPAPRKVIDPESIKDVRPLPLTLHISPNAPPVMESPDDMVTDV